MLTKQLDNLIPEAQNFMSILAICKFQFCLDPTLSEISIVKMVKEGVKGVANGALTIKDWAKHPNFQIKFYNFAKEWHLYVPITHGKMYTVNDVVFLTQKITNERNAGGLLRLCMDDSIAKQMNTTSLAGFNEFLENKKNFINFLNVNQEMNPCKFSAIKTYQILKNCTIETLASYGK